MPFWSTAANTFYRTVIVFIRNNQHSSTRDNNICLASTGIRSSCLTVPTSHWTSNCLSTLLSYTYLTGDFENVKRKDAWSVWHRYGGMTVLHGNVCHDNTDCRCVYITGEANCRSARFVWSRVLATIHYRWTNTCRIVMLARACVCMEPYMVNGSCNSRRTTKALSGLYHITGTACVRRASDYLPRVDWN